MASIESHLAVIEGQIECLEEHGHLKGPAEYWGFQDLRDAALKLRRIFVNNDRRMNE
jgi:hypothetical protein